MIESGNWLGKVLEDMKYRKADPQEDMRLYLYSAVRKIQYIHVQCCRKML